jgi:hypothetical protein
LPFCDKCGKEAAADALSCPGCGRQLRPSRPTVPLTIPRWKIGKYRIVGLVILTLIVGVVLGYSFSQLPSQRPTLNVTQYVPREVTVYVTQTTTQHVAMTTTSTPVGGEYVGIAYLGVQTLNYIQGATPGPGRTFLVVELEIVNHGYELFPTSWDCFYVIINGQQFTYSDTTLFLPPSDRLPSSGVLNGLMIHGYIIYEVPANYSTFQLLYKDPLNDYTIQYVPHS